MAKNIGTLAVRKCNPALRKLLQLQIFWYSRVYLLFFALEQHKKQRRKVKSAKILHKTQKMYWTKLLAPLT